MLSKISCHIHFKQILKQDSKILHMYKEDDDVLLEIPRNQVTWVNITQTGYRCFHFRILANYRVKRNNLQSFQLAEQGLFFFYFVNCNQLHYKYCNWWAHFLCYILLKINEHKKLENIEDLLVI